MERREVEQLLKKLEPTPDAFLQKEVSNFIESVTVRQLQAKLNLNEAQVKTAWEHWKRERYEVFYKKDQS